jgi:acetyl-CoA C-acetyltransferase
MPEAVIVAAKRSPIGRAHKGSLTQVRSDDLVAMVIRQVLDELPQLDPTAIDDLLLGCGLPGGEQGMNMARVVATLLGLDSVPGTTVTRYCASSLQTTRMAFHAIKAGEGDIFISAGVESISRSAIGNSDRIPGIDVRNPVFLEAMARTEDQRDGGAWVDPRSFGELPDVYISMGQTAENLAQITGVSRAEQDEYAQLSQNRAERATESGFWRREMVPVTLADGSVVERDDSPRVGVTAERLAQLEPVFRPDGTVTAGN